MPLFEFFGRYEVFENSIFCLILGFTNKSTVQIISTVQILEVDVRNNWAVSQFPTLYPSRFNEEPEIQKQALSIFPTGFIRTFDVSFFFRSKMRSTEKP